MDELVKSIRVGTVSFFGIVVPGVCLITMLSVGTILPLIVLYVGVTGFSFPLKDIYDSFTLLILAILVIFSYIFGYILRLSSPDLLDRISAKKVINTEAKKRYLKFYPKLSTRMKVAKKLSWYLKRNTRKTATKKFYRQDGWPFRPENPMDKYPYLEFRDYLEKRGHFHLTKDIVTWGENVGENWSSEDLSENPIRITRRSKTTINKLKLKVRLYCPGISSLLEAKEGHIRLMAGIWAAFRFAMLPTFIIWIIFFVLGILELAGKIHISIKNTFSMPEVDFFFVLSMIGLGVLLIMWLSNRRIKSLFHYRRVNELFHIVQAAFLAKEVEEKIKFEKST